MPHSVSFRSLRRRLLGPIVACALIAAVLVAIGSYWWGARWAREELRTRFQSIRVTLADSEFPMNQMVLQSVADLTQTELVALDEQGSVLHRTIDVSASQLAGIHASSDAGDRDAGVSDAVKQETEQIIQLETAGGQRYVAFRFRTVRGVARGDGVCDVVVLFNEASLAAKRNRAALLPLVTGGSTILALSSITLLLTSKLIGRIGVLRSRVEKVAAGDFRSTATDRVADEVGELGDAVDNMAGQLDQLWSEVNRQQSEKLLHQIAGGMAHQLRNSLTGARMAVELHQQECSSHDEGLGVAVDQIELSEDYVRRLLLAASGRQDDDHPMDAKVCLEDVRCSMNSVAKHLRINTAWQIDDSIGGQLIADGPGFTAAITNLVHNALQAGNAIRVDCCLLDDGRVRIEVRDNGTGVPIALGGDLFEPFVTSKPEGMGLGLSVVRRAAERLDGTVQWRREDDWTVFNFTVPTSSQV